MSQPADNGVEVLARALTQATALLGEVDAGTSGNATPCENWTVSDLADHMIQGVEKFATSVRGGEVDWTQPTPHVEGDRAAAFRARADDLLAAWAEPVAAGLGPDWQTAEVSVHVWDLASALGRSTADLDPEPAERGLAFMTAHLKDDLRGEHFRPAQDVPAGADAYQRLAAFAGRSVPTGA